MKSVKICKSQKGRGRNGEKDLIIKKARERKNRRKETAKDSKKKKTARERETLTERKRERQ